MSGPASIIALMLLILNFTAPAFAQQGDLKVARIRSDHPDASFLFFDLTLESGGKIVCTPTKVHFRSGQQGLAGEFEIYRPHPLTSFAAESRGAMVGLLPGVWTLDRIECLLGARTNVLNGAVAQIRINRDEMLNGGDLVIDMTLQQHAQLFKPAVIGSHPRLENLSPEVAEAFRQRAPEAFAHAKRRNFTNVTAAQ
jgi:hypothetical protein